MWSEKQYLDMLSLFLQAKPPKPHELRPCYEHELLLHAICRPKEPLTKDEITDLVWNMANGPKKKTSKSRKRQSGGMDVKREPTDAEIIFGGCVKSPHCRCTWGRSRIDWLNKLERQHIGQYYYTWQEPPGVIAAFKEPPPNISREKLKKTVRECSRARMKRPGCGAMLLFAYGRCFGHKSRNFSDVPDRNNTS
ncbi:uncharacterized protein [Drosophila kikkawai]|uniref:Uncharacterized protein n=1 Tax=Drosophila kikkawai TaxID=30033 RepID=A0A6P4IS35_DROKI|nr:uncharacterized protein LOC108081227 [Drosophila kikkawai]